MVFTQRHYELLFNLYENLEELNAQNIQDFISEFEFEKPFNFICIETEYGIMNVSLNEEDKKWFNKQITETFNIIKNPNLTLFDIECLDMVLYNVLIEFIDELKENHFN